jgi:MoaA/NifB/PqqE/SkfB family radical SAM enzyme
MNRKICYWLDEIDNILKGRIQYPISYEIDPSNCCQNKCSFCMYASYLKNNRQFLDLKIFDSIIKEISFLGGKSVTFTGGGEPLTHSHFHIMVKEAIKLNLEIGLITNGISLDKIIKHNLDKHFKFIRVSLNAASSQVYKKITGTDFFDLVIENIKTLVKRNKCETIGLSFVICEDNEYEIRQMNELGEKLKVSYCQIKPMINDKIFDFVYQNPDSCKKIISTERYYLEEDYKLACTIAGLIGVIGADNKAYFCCQHRGKSEFAIGNVQKESLSTIFINRKSFIPDVSKCSSCRYMNYAKGYKEFSQDKYSFLRHKNFL